MAKVDWSQFTPVEPEAAAVDWSQFTPAEAPAAPIEKSFFDRLGDTMNSARDTMLGLAGSGKESVLEGVKLEEPEFNPAEAARLSRRNYAEQTARDERNIGAPSATAAKGKLIALRDDGVISRATDLVGSQVDAYSAGLGMKAGDALTALGADGAGQTLRNKALNLQDRSDLTNMSVSLNANGAFEKYAPQVLAVFPTMAVAAATGGLPVMFGIAEVQAYAEGRKAGLSPLESLGRAVPVGAAEVIGEKLGGTGKLLDALESAAVKGFTAQSLKNLSGRLLASGAREIPSEEATYLMQFGIDKAPGIGLNQDAGWDEFKQGAIDTAIVAAGAGGVQVGGGVALSALQKPTPVYNPTALAESKGFLTAAPNTAAPKVESQPTTPVAPTVTPRAKAPTAADPIAPMDDAAILAGVPVEGDAAQAVDNIGALLGQTQTATPDATAEGGAQAPAVQPLGYAGTGPADAAPAAGSDTEQPAVNGVATAKPVQSVAAPDFKPKSSYASTTMSPAAQNLQQRMQSVQNTANGTIETGTTSLGVDRAQSDAAATTGAGGTVDVQQAVGGQPVFSAKPAQGRSAPTVGSPKSLAPTAPDATINSASLSLQRDRGVRIASYKGPLTAGQQVASAFANANGRTFTLVEQTQGKPGAMPNGFMLPGTNHIVVDKSASDAPVLVAAHEIYHGLPTKLRLKLNKSLRALFNEGKVGEFGKEFGVTPDQFEEEIPAYMAQAVASRPTFWSELKGKMGNADFSELAAFVLGKFKSLMSGAEQSLGEGFLQKYIGDESKILEAQRLLADAYTESMREQGLQPDAALVTAPVMSNKPVPTDGEADDSRPDIEQADIPESVDAQSGLANTLSLSKSKIWQKGRDLKLAMQNAVQAAATAASVDVSAPSDATTKYLARVGVKDALLALKQNANAVGWYDLKTRQALSVISLVHPEVARDENARFAMVWAMAVTSNGLKVGKNFEIAEKVYSEYKRTGQMPTNLGIGTAAGAINDSLGLFNELKEKWGIDNLRQFMLTNFTVSEITGIAKDLKPGGEHADVVVRGAAIIGPKIGNGFFSNLYGNFDALTMDRWLVRTWGRWTGTLISPMPQQTAKATARLADNLKALAADSAEMARLSEALGVPITADMALPALATAVQEASMDPATRTVMNTSPLGEELRKAGNGLAKYLDGQKEAPAGPTERKYIRKVFGEILSELRKDPQYKDLSMADLQAVLWYAEKRLYESAKQDTAIDDEVDGYSDDDAPDYANAAAAVARAAGVTDRRIKNVLKQEQENGRSTDARRADGEKEADRFGLQAAPGSFADGQRKDFVEWQALKRIGNSRLGGKELSWSYEGKSAGDGGRVRRLADLGVSYVAEWKLGQKAKTVFTANGLKSISLFELAPGDQGNAQKFADAITASKNSTPFGAAVYVYPTKSTEDEVGYNDMRLFLSKDGKNGVAVKSNGDIVSVFSENRSGNVRSLMQTALAAGGRKLDAFDTVLPRIYSKHGFRVVARTKWNDEYAPDGWDKDTFESFNGGEPDVVFMAYDPAHGEMYEPTDGKTYDDYDKAEAAQKRVVNKVAKDVPKSGPVFSNKAQDLDQDVTLDIPLDNGKTAKLTVNAQTYITQLDARQSALEMVKECMA